VLSVWGLACAYAPVHEHEIADGWRGAPEVSRVLLAPMNATGTIAEELQPGAEQTFALAVEHLEANGIAVERVPLFRFRNAWTRSFEGVELDPKAPELPSEAIANLAKRLAVEHDFDVLLMPALEIRNARVNQFSQRWDGVSRGWKDERMVGGGSTRWTGDVPAASLRVRVYAATGEEVFDGVGGLDVMFKYTQGNQMTLVDAPLSDADHLREGVRIAFDPFIPFVAE
jgi:hypothetical protein